MELKWLEDFLSIASTGNFSKSADLRNVTQSAFSRRIKNLEFWLGTELIDRSQYPTRLTPHGLIFREVAEEAVALLHGARHEFQGTRQQDRATLGFAALHSLADSVFPGFIVGLRNAGFQMPPARVKGYNLHDCVQAVQAGEADFMLTYAHESTPILLAPDDFPSLVLCTDRFLPVSSPDADGRPRYTFGASQPFLTYSPNCLLGRVMEKLSARMEEIRRFTPVYENSMASALKSMALAGQGLCWLPETLIRQELEDGRLLAIGGAEQVECLEVRLYRAMNRSRPAVERFWQFLNKIHQQE